MTTAWFFYHGFTGDPDLEGTLMSLVVVASTLAGAICISIFRYKRIKKNENTINTFLYWTVNGGILLIPYLFLLWLLLV